MDNFLRALYYSFCIFMLCLAVTILFVNERGMTTFLDNKTRDMKDGMLEGKFLGDTYDTPDVVSCDEVVVDILSNRSYIVLVNGHSFRPGEFENSDIPFSDIITQTTYKVSCVYDKNNVLTSVNYY